MNITKDTKLKDVYATPSGHDIVARLFYALGLDENIIKKSIIANLKLKSLKTLSFGKFDDEALEAFISLLNSFNIEVDNDECEVKKQWWKQAVFYQIYPRSFKDTNNDGIGDLRGIISKLDYLQSLGINALWICPFYDSPNADNGYDIRDYKKIMAEFGTMSDCEELIQEAHKRDIKVVIDLVMNHTSDEHEWFEKSKNNIEPYNDYYIWKDKKNDSYPNNWESLFSGPAWKFFKQRDKYALHLFAEKQIDLNWDNPKVRQEMYDIANYWLDKGTDGFRLDVVSFISKNPEMSDGNKLIGKLVAFTGIEHYFHGPHLDEYLQEFNEKCLKPHKAYTVGECPGAGIELSRLIAGDDRNELSQLFSFDHIENPGKIRYDIYDFDLRKMIPEIVRWQTTYSNHCWPTVFFNNHDNPRMVSKIDHEGKYTDILAKLLVLMQMSLKGTPYIYQGDEIGMVDYPFKAIDEYRDIESINMYYIESKKRKIDSKEALKHLLYGSRDHARIPMQWSSDNYAGFSNTEPWISVHPDYKDRNVDSQINDENSILNFYKELIKLRKDNEALVYGSFLKLKTNKNIFMYKRQLDNNEFTILINLTDKKQNKPQINDELVVSNYNDSSSYLRPYEAIIFKK